MKEKDFYQVSLKLILKNSQGEVLIMGGVPGGSYEGFYDFPGGRIDTDEFYTPFAEVIEREAEEELGDISFKLYPKPVAVGRHLIPAEMTSQGREIPVLYVFFKAEYIDGEIKPSQEHAGFKWVDLSKQPLEKLFKSGNLEGIKMYLSNSI